MIIPFSSPGEIGVIQDIPAHVLPPNAWSSATNIRFNDGYAEKFLGHSAPFGTPSIAPYYLLSLQTPSLQYWIYAGLTDAYITDGATHREITRTASDYSSTADENWTGGILGGIPILCNGFDAPQMLFPAAPGNTLSDLSNWPANTTAKVVKPFKNFLIALNMNEDGEHYPYIIRWSHPADPGTVPSSWDYTDETLDAGRSPLSESGGDIIDGGALRDSFVIYREFSTWVMRYVGGQFIFEIRQIFPSSGIFSKRCFVEFEGKHCVLTADDLIVHDGSSTQSVLDSVYRDTLFTELDGATNNIRTYLSVNYARNEIWVCYPTGSDEQPTKALIWNYRHNTVGFRALPGAAHIAFDVIDPQSADTWDSDSDTWDSDSTKWDVKQYNPTKRSMLMADTVNTKLFKLDDTNQFNAVSFTSTLERTGLPLLGRGSKGEPQVDFDSIKHMSRIYPRFTGSGTVTIYGGAQDVVGGAVTYDSGTTFTIGTDHKVDLRSTGRLLAIKFESTGDVSWKLHGFDLDIKKVGGR